MESGDQEFLQVLTGSAGPDGDPATSCVDAALRDRVYESYLGDLTGNDEPLVVTLYHQR